LLARLLREKVSRAGGWVPLSHGQRALWELERRAPESAANTEAFAWRHLGELDLPALEAVCLELTARHPCLRTTYRSLAGEPRQRFHEKQVPVFQVVDASAWGQEQLRQQISAEAHRPFDLERGPVFHVYLYRRSARETVILTRIHHLAIDLWSMALLMEELQLLYLTRRFGIDPQLPPVPAHYGDFVRWQEQMLAGPEGARLWDYWRQQIGGHLSGLNLPTDRPRPPAPTYRGATLPFHLDEGLTGQLRALARDEQTTLFTTLLAALQVWLCRRTGQEDVVVGSRAAGRSRPEFERVVGDFANPIALRADLSGNPSFRAALRRARQAVLGALAHQDYPFSLLLGRLAPAPAPGDPPPCNVAFVLQKPHRFAAEQQEHKGVASFGAPSQARTGARLVLADQVVELFPVELRVARHDLELEMVEAGQELLGWLRYSLDLFATPTVARLLGSFEALLRGIVTDPDQPLADLPLEPPLPPRNVERSNRRAVRIPDGRPA
jgi:hypothetical protein